MPFRHDSTGHSLKPALPVLSPLPPAATFVGRPDLVQLPLEPRHQIFGGLQSRLFFPNVGRKLSDESLRGLAFPANKISVLLQGATVDISPHQAGIGVAHATEQVILGRGEEITALLTGALA
jgi:hypothetical protein